MCPNICLCKFLGSDCSDFISREYFNCTSSSTSSDCHNIFNSKSHQSWKSNSRMDSKWIDVQLGQEYNLSKIQLKLSSTAKNITFMISDETFSRKIIQNEAVWSNFVFNNMKPTKSVNFTIPETTNVTIIEIRAYGCPGTLHFISFSNTQLIFFLTLKICFVFFILYVFSLLAVIVTFEDPGYPLSKDKDCDEQMPHESFGMAMIFCENAAKYDKKCKGIWDANCDGKTIYTCGKINNATEPDSPSNGCTYVKKGNLFITKLLITSVEF